MLKLGVFHLDQFQPDDRSLFGRARWRVLRNRISLHLLKTDIPASPREIMAFEQIMQNLELSSGIYRTTFRGRFRELDPFLNQILTEHFSLDGDLDVQDWAASDCLASSEWAVSIFNRYPKARLTASDLTLYLIDISDGTYSVVEERSGVPLQVLTPLFVVNLQRRNQRPRLLTRFLLAKAESVVARMKPALPQEWLTSDSDSLSCPPYFVRKLQLVHPEAMLFVKQNRRFSIVQHSIFEPLLKQADVIRTMNIFNPKYFTADQIRTGCRAVLASLRLGGLWIVGRTRQDHPPVHDVSIFKKTAGGCSLLSRYGNGSEIESLIPTQTTHEPGPTV